VLGVETLLEAGFVVLDQSPPAAVSTPSAE
jgi:hypothetical protein